MGVPPMSFAFENTFAPDNHVTRIKNKKEAPRGRGASFI